MAARHFCDLCDKPAMDNGFTHLTFKRKLMNRYGYHLKVEFTEAVEHCPRTSDRRADICSACMAEGLRAIAGRLEQQSDEKEDA